MLHRGRRPRPGELGQLPAVLPIHLPQQAADVVPSLLPLVGSPNNGATRSCDDRHSTAHVSASANDFPPTPT